MRRARARGVAIVELAILLGPLTLFLFGTVELGRACYQYDTIVKATRSAARYLSVRAAGTGLAEAKCLVAAATSDPTNCSPSIVPGLTVNMVSVRYMDGVSTCPAGTTRGCGAINLVEVCVNCAESADKFAFVSLARFFVPDITFGPIRSVARRGGT